MGDFAGTGALEEYARLVRTDPEFRARLRAEPAAALAERGMSVLPGTELRVVENSAGVHHVVLPPNPNALLADDSLHAVAGGAGDLAVILPMLPHLHLISPH